MPRSSEGPILSIARIAAGAAALSGAGAALSSEAPLHGARTNEHIDQIVVVAHKDERSVRDLAASVTIVDGTSLKDQIATSISDVFRYSPGIDYEAAGLRFGAEGVNIRGIGGNRVAILVDGVPLSDQFSVGSFSNATRDFLNAGMIRDVQVLHGPASALYGSSAIGGVVSVRTPDPREIAGKDRFAGDALLAWRDSDASTHGQATLAFDTGAYGLLVAASRRSGQEPRAAAAPTGVDTLNYERETLLLKAVGDDSRGNTWSAALIHQAANTKSDLNSMLGRGRYASTTALEGDDGYAMDLLNLSWEFGSPESLFDAGIVRTYFETVSVEQATLDERANARIPVSIDRYFAFDQDIAGIEANVWKNLDGRVLRHRIGFGVEYRQRSTEEYRDGLSTNLESGARTGELLGEVFPLRDFPLSDTYESAIFLEDTISFGDWIVIAALRMDRFELSPRADAMYADDYPFAEPVSLDESDLSPKLGLIWKMTPNVEIYSQYSHGFRAPPFADANIGLEIPLFNFRAIPNPDLRSESSDGIDLGMRFTGDRSTARVSLFHTRYEDFIESRVRVGQDPESGRVLFQSRNLRATTIEGIEAAYSTTFGGERRAFGFDAAAYLARGENDETGAPLNSVGPAQAVFGLRWFSPDGRSQVQVKATLTDSWDERDETGGRLFRPAGHAVFDLYLSRSLGRTARLRAGLHNLTDRVYWHWSDVRGLAPADPAIPYLSKAGRGLSVSLNLAW